MNSSSIASCGDERRCAHEHRTRYSLRLSVFATVATLLGLVLAPAAHADLEWLGTGGGEFPNKPSEVEPAGHRAVAVNETTGDVYEVDGRGGKRVLRFNKEGKFLEGWGWGVGDGQERFERCGPEGERNAKSEPLYPECKKGNLAEGFSADGLLREPAAVAVDQATGAVFVLDQSPNVAKVVQKFSATGEFMSRFASLGTASPEEVGELFGAAIAVDSAGHVYLVDDGTAHGPRVMVFEEDISGEYVYRESLFVGKFNFGAYLSLDDAGRFYLTADGHIYRFDSATAAAPAWQIPVVETEATVVEPVNGELFYFSQNPKERLFHRVRPVGANGKVDTTFPGAPGQTSAYSGAFNPHAALGGHPAGVLYVAQVESPRGLIFAPSIKNPPKVGGEAVETVGSSSATLKAVVNPEGASTEYWFEYGSEGPCSEHMCTKAPAAGAKAGDGSGEVAVSAKVAALRAGTPYYFRVVAKNEFGEVLGNGETFKTFPTPVGSADGRAYELVSPVDKHGGEVIPANPEISSCVQCEPGINSIKMPEQSAPDGESVVYEGFPFFPEAEGQRGALKENEYRAARTGSGWVTTNLSVEGETHGFGYRAFSPGLAKGVLQEKEVPLASGALPFGYEDLYMWEANGALAPLVQNLLGPLPAHKLELGYTGGSSDLEHLTFEANEPLTHSTPVAPEAPGVGSSERDLYEWAEGSLRLVNVLPGNATAAPGAIGAGEALNSRTEAGPDTSNAVSADGTRIFWTDFANGRLYVRENGTTTREVAKGCKLTVALAERVCFLTASADGSRVLLSNGALIDVAVEPAAKIFDLTNGHGGFEGIAGASNDLERIYFVDNEVVSTAENPEHAVAKAGQPNLFMYEAEAGAFRFVGTLNAFDGTHGTDFMLSTWAPAPTDRLAQVTPDGRFVAFNTISRLTEYNNAIEGEHCGATTGEPSAPKACSEVYVYDAQEKSLACASCNPSGEPPAGPSWLSLLQPIVSRFPQPTNLLSNGRVFFDSFDALTAGDQFPGVENVYEHELRGQGSCEASECLNLISTGRSPLDAEFLSADESGKNVFFTTRQQVLPEQDRDELVDLYDAREGGGFAITVPPAGCDGEECRPVVSPPPGPPTGGSSTFVGAGNLSKTVERTTVKHPPPKRCRKGMVRNKHHKCVRKKRRSARGASRGRQGTVRR